MSSSVPVKATPALNVPDDFQGVTPLEFSMTAGYRFRDRHIIARNNAEGKVNSRYELLLRLYASMQVNLSARRYARTWTQGALQKDTLARRWGGEHWAGRGAVVSGPRRSRHILLLKRHAEEVVCWLNKELMPGRSIITEPRWRGPPRAEGAGATSLAAPS